MAVANAQSTKAYCAEGVACILGLSLTQWATIIGIVVALGSLVLAFLTYRSNKWRNETLVKENADHHRKVRAIQKGHDTE